MQLRALLRNTLLRKTAFTVLKFCRSRLFEFATVASQISASIEISNVDKAGFVTEGVTCGF